MAASSVLPHRQVVQARALLWAGDGVANEEIARRIGDQIGRQTGQRVELTQTVDPDIIGGLVLRVGNSILDASIRNRLETLRKNVAKAA